MKYLKINLPYKTNELEPYIDELTVETHYNKHHNTYETKFNDGIIGTKLEDYSSLEEIMNNYSSIDESLKALVRNSGGGLINHNFYFGQFVVNRELTDKEAKIKEIAIKQFGSLDSFKEEVTNKGLSVFGSGWVWAVINNNVIEIMTTPNQENPWMQNKNDVILGIDVWEHAYYLKYKSNRKGYIDNIWNLTMFK